MRRNYAVEIVREFEAAVTADAFAGSGHPGLVDWHAERLAVARERMVRRLMGLPPDLSLRMPEPPEVEY